MHASYSYHKFVAQLKSWLERVWSVLQLVHEQTLVRVVCGLTAAGQVPAQLHLLVVLITFTLSLLALPQGTCKSRYVRTLMHVCMYVYTYISYRPIIS